MISSHYDGIHSTLFFDDPHVLDFRPGNWVMALLPFQGNFSESEFRAIEELAEDTGDFELVVTDIESVPPHQVTGVIPVSFNAYSACRTGIRSALYLHIFPPSGKWGVIVTCDDVTVVGGQRELMETFVNALGGWPSVKKRFMEECQGTWLEQEPNRKLLSKTGWNL